MRPLRVALAQINTTVGDFDGNRARILEAAHEAAALDADLVLSLSSPSRASRRRTCCCVRRSSRRPDAPSRGCSMSRAGCRR